MEMQVQAESPVDGMGESRVGKWRKMMGQVGAPQQWRELEHSEWCKHLLFSPFLCLMRWKKIERWWKRWWRRNNVEKCLKSRQEEVGRWMVAICKTQMTPLPWPMQQP